jgi:hypothetical protein
MVRQAAGKPNPNYQPQGENQMRGQTASFWKKYDAMQLNMAKSCMRQTSDGVQRSTVPSTMVKAASPTQVIVVRAA